MQKRVIKYLLCCLFAAFSCSCANRGVGPQGGPKDTVPPSPVKSMPENGVVSFTGNRIEIHFNEYIELDNVGQNLLMSPPQQNPPEVKARGKRVTVHFVDSLQDSTTYTIDFGNAIVDFTERNPLRGYCFAFSTGPFIDTLELHGLVMDAGTLNPVPGIITGIHSNHEDSAFTTMPFARIARTDSTGHFRIGNIHEGTYRLYGVEDVSRDNRLTIGERLAFTDSLYTPAYMDSTEHVLWLFRPEQQRLYLQRTLREQQHMITLLFSSQPDSLPSWRALRPSEYDSLGNDSGWVDPTPYMLPQYTAHNDTVILWLTDSIAIAQDTIMLEARYRRTDSIYQLEWYTDTLRAVWRAPRLSAKAKEAQERQRRNRKLELKSNARKSFELYDTLYVQCTTPLDSIRAEGLHLLEKVDTVLKPITFAIEQEQMGLRLVADLQKGKAYELRVDSAAMQDIYGVVNLYTSYSLQMKTPEDYSTLRVKMKTACEHGRVQLLDKKDQVVRELPIVENEVFFQYLKPDTYYLRMYIDEDENGKWTTGSWEDKRQPEAVYYYPQSIQTKSNWDFEEEWDYTAVPQLQSKPKALINVGGKKK